MHKNTIFTPLCNIDKFLGSFDVTEEERRLHEDSSNIPKVLVLLHDPDVEHPR